MPYHDVEEYLKNSPDVTLESEEPSRSREEVDLEASLAGAHSQAKGAWGEGVAKVLLEAKGVQMVEQIATPVRIVGTTKLSGQTYYAIIWGEKVSGDWRGILPGGVRVLAEAKARDHNLRWSDLQDHQREALDKNHECGGVSLLVYVHPDVRVVMRWPVPGFAPYKSITPERAKEMEWSGVYK